MPASLRYRTVWLGLGLLLTAAILVLALQPLPTTAIVEIWSDKVWHALAFVVLMVWFAALYPREYGWRVFVCLLCYGLLIEALQGMTPTRNVDAGDVLANIAGAAAGWALVRAGFARWWHWVERLLGLS